MRCPSSWNYRKPLNVILFVLGTVEMNGFQGRIGLQAPNPSFGAEAGGLLRLVSQHASGIRPFLAGAANGDMAGPNPMRQAPGPSHLTRPNGGGKTVLGSIRQR